MWNPWHFSLKKQSKQERELGGGVELDQLFIQTPFDPAIKIWELISQDPFEL
jgi:hypothetical protein